MVSVPRGKMLTPPPLLAELPLMVLLLMVASPELTHKPPPAALKSPPVSVTWFEGQVAAAGGGPACQAEIGGRTAVPFDRAVVALDGDCRW